MKYVKRRRNIGRDPVKNRLTQYNIYTLLNVILSLICMYVGVVTYMHVFLFLKNQHFYFFKMKCEIPYCSS